MNLTNLSKFLIKKNHLYINNRMLLYFGDANHQTVNSELKKAYMKSGIQIANGNEKLYTMLCQVKASQNSRQMMISNTHNDFQPFACIMTEKLDTLVSICVYISYYPLLWFLTFLFILN